MRPNQRRGRISGRRTCQRESTRQLKFNKARRDTSRILEINHAGLRRGRTCTTRAAILLVSRNPSTLFCTHLPVLSLSPSSSGSRPPSCGRAPGSPWQSQDCGYMERYEANMTSQMPPRTTGPMKFPSNNSNIFSSSNAGTPSNRQACPQPSAVLTSFFVFQKWFETINGRLRWHLTLTSSYRTQLLLSDGVRVREGQQLQDAIAAVGRGQSKRGTAATGRNCCCRTGSE